MLPSVRLREVKKINGGGMMFKSKVIYHIIIPHLKEIWVAYNRRQLRKITNYLKGQGLTFEIRKIVLKKGGEKNGN